VLTWERLATVLDYDADTGIFTWKQRLAQRVHVGDRAGSQRADGVWQIRLDRGSYYANRLAWLYMTGHWPGSEVMHADGDPSNDRWANLRLRADLDRFFLVQRRPCATCIYGPNSHLDVTMLESKVRDPKQPSFFRGYWVCHNAYPREPVCCAGFWQRHREAFARGQIAERLGLVRYVVRERFPHRGDRSCPPACT
jgi:hypothetical protein